jgi:uncharacterized repeat protein (TIGR03806 family)
MRVGFLVLGLVLGAAAAACTIGRSDVAEATAADTTATPPSCQAGPRPASGSSDGIPAKLSESGCFQADSPTTPASVLVPYDVASPLWSDGADKHRWFALPPGGKIHLGADGHFELPVGSVLVKEFRIGGKRLETRLLMHHTDGSWAGYSYEWNDAETDAVLLLGGKTKPLAAPDAGDADGGTASGPATWHYPSRAECNRCHNRTSGYSLGLEAAQLNTSFEYAAGAQNQLDALQALGLFDAALDPSRPQLLTPTATDDPATLEARARSYLHANCSFCHRPQGPGAGPADFRFGRSFAETRVCNAAPLEDLGVAGAKLLTPGKPELSTISLRMHRRDGEAMPPIGTCEVDAAGAEVIDAWIRSVTACP